MLPLCHRGPSLVFKEKIYILYIFYPVKIWKYIKRKKMLKKQATDHISSNGCIHFYYPMRVIFDLYRGIYGAEYTYFCIQWGLLTMDNECQ